jgi:hypothetical protein
MFLTKLKWAALVLLALGALGTGAGLLTRTSATPPAPPGRAAGKPAAPVPEKTTKGDSPEVKRLLKERRDVLKEAVEAGRKEYLAGRSTMPVAADLAHELLKAELELASESAERIAAHEAYYTVMRKLEAHAKVQYEAGRMTLLEYKRAQAARLGAEIGLRRAGGKPKAERK